MPKFLCLLIGCMLSFSCFSQSYNIDSSLNALNMQKDSMLQAMMHADSVKADKEYQEKIKWEKLKSVEIYPVFNAGEFSGVVPVKDPTEIPDPILNYKLLFEVTINNPDSAADQINFSLSEVARIINLHVASGIPLKKIFPVIIIHAKALNAITTNVYYQKHYKMDNPNIKLINDLSGIGARFIACGQAMAFFNFKKEDLLPVVKVSLTAQTALSSYQLMGYVKYKIQID